MRMTKMLMIWILLTFGFFFIQSALLFYTFIVSIPTGSVLIITNDFGELNIELIISGILAVLSFIGLILIIKWDVVYE